MRRRRAWQRGARGSGSRYSQTGAGFGRYLGISISASVTGSAPQLGPDLNERSIFVAQAAKAGMERVGLPFSARWRGCRQCDITPATGMRHFWRISSVISRPYRAFCSLIFHCLPLSLCALRFSATPRAGRQIYPAGSSRPRLPALGPADDHIALRLPHSEQTSRVPIGDGHLRAVAFRHLGGVGLDLMAAIEAPTISRTCAAAGR